METTTANGSSLDTIKCPWEGAEKNWQKWGKSHTSPFFSDLVFKPWKELQSDALIHQKEKITQFEKNKQWELLKKLVNPYEMVFTHEDPHFHPSLSLIKPLSRSYFKMIEMLDILDFFPRLSKTNPNIRTAHIAEGPGGFVQATFDLAERYGKKIKQATAMTLRPTDSRIPGWRRATNFLHNHKEIKLHYGYDDTGNIYIKENQDSFLEAVNPGVHLFTADGGFDFSSDYSMQEHHIFRLFACSSYTGLRSLLIDGSMIIKFFDTFSESTSILLMCMARCFKEWKIYKPALSRPCNSERYFLARGFLGIHPSINILFEKICKNAAEDMYPTGLELNVSQEEVDYIQAQQNLSISNQLDSLKKSLYFASHLEEWYTKQLSLDFQCSLKWCNRFKIPTILKAPCVISPPPIWSLKDECTSLQDADPQSRLPGVG
jgi:23S rRNA U2552 (ribose-2'-O)-methylase RlmE/FtsJ